MAEGGRRSRLDRGLAAAAVLLAVLPSLALGSARPDLRWAALGAAVLFAVAVAGRSLRRGRPVPVPAEAVLLALAGLASLLQAVPWGAAVTGALGGPGHLRADATRQAADLPGPWPFPSLDPLASLAEGAALVALAALLAALVARADRRAGRRALVLAVGVAGLLQAAVGAAGLVAGFPLRSLLVPGPLAATPGFHGTFLNDNHTASLTLLGTFAWLGLAAGASGPRRAAAGALAALLAGATVATGSRGGAAVLWVAGLAWVALRALSAGRAGSPGRAPALRALAAGGLLLGAAVAALAVDQWLFRHAGRSWWPDAWEGKTRVFGPALRLVLDHPLAGTGRGSFPDAVTAYNDAGPRWTYDHVENLPLQALCDWGLPVGLALLAAGLVLGARRLAASPRGPLSQAALLGVGAVLAKDLGDFALEVPGVSFPALALLACALGARGAAAAPGPAREAAPGPGPEAAPPPAPGTARRPRGPRPGRGLRPGRALAAALAVAALCGAGALAAGPSREARHAPLAGLAVRAAAGEAAAEADVADALARAVSLHPADAEAFRLAATADLASGRPLRALARADHARVLDPWSVAAGLLGLQAAREAGLPGEIGPRSAELLGLRPDAEEQAFAMMLAGGWPPGDVLAALDPVAGARDRHLAWLARRRQPARAIRLLEARLAREPGDLDSLVRLGGLLLDTGDLARGDAAALQLLAQAPERPEGWSLAARAAWSRDEPLQALALHREAAARSPDPVAENLQALRCLLVLDRRDEFDALARQVEEGIGADPYRRAALERVLASREVRREAWPAALERLDRAEGLVPWDPDVRVAKGRVRLQSGDREGAIREARRALALDPGHPGALDLTRAAQAPAASPGDAPEAAPPGP